tara:strand:- start:1486 stop:2520 length:1035 start_codon:yes stop_codon:yes gene_type:complete
MKIFYIIPFINLLIAQDTTFNCNGWSQIIFDQYIVENNIWGQGDINDFTQCIYRTGSENNINFGWNWDWPNENNDVKSYPEVIYGKKPWSSNSTTQELPIKIGNIDEIYVDYDLNMNANGSYNLAFEFWVTTDSLSSQAGITTEVMIWMDRNIINPAGSLIASVNFDGFEYKVYRANWDSWTYIAFLSTETQYSGLLAVHNFVHYLVNEGLLNADEYFADFEMGNEVIYGTGQTDVRKYDIYINSNPLLTDAYTSKSNEYNLSGNYPNPFNAATSIDFYMPSNQYVNIKVYDMLGKEISTLINDKLTIGKHSVQWDASNYPSGLYFLNIEFENYFKTTKILLLK